MLNPETDRQAAARRLVCIPQWNRRSEDKIEGKIGLGEYTGAPGVSNQYRYDLWGMPQGTDTEAVDNPLRFKARMWDPDAKLADFRNRWYDPEIGRFISEDPIGLAGGINVYRFVGNNPVSGWDPFGLDFHEGPCNPNPCELDPIGVTGFPLPNPLWDPFFADPDDSSPGPTGGKRRVPGGSNIRKQIGKAFKGAAEAITCFNQAADRNFETTDAFIRQEFTVPLYDLGEITIQPGTILLVTGSFLGNASRIEGAVETAYRGAPSVGRNGAPLRGYRFLGNVGARFVKGTLAVSATFTAGLALGSSVLAAVQCS